MTRAIDILFRVLDAIMVVCMAGMFVMVLGNVVLRAGFNTGIDMSEELPRFLFIWLTFVGAVVAIRENRHLGVDSIVRAVPPFWRRVFWLASQVLMLVCGAYIFIGTWMQHPFNAESVSPVMQLPMSWVYDVTFFTGAAIVVICLANLLKFARGQVRDDELVQVEEEGMHEAATTIEQVRKP